MALRIPKDIAESLKLKVDNTFIFRVENGKLLLVQMRENSDYTPDELLAGEIEPSQEFFWGKPDGEEVW